MPRAHARLAALLACSLVSACGSVVPPLTFGDESSSSGSESTTSAPTGPTSSESSTSSSSSSDSNFFDVPPAPAICNPYTQECPPGEKCNWYAHNGSGLEVSRCVPVFPDPAQLGEPCRARGFGLDGIDDCDVGLMCWDVDDSGDGYCVALCGGSPDALTCPPDQVAYAVGSGLCLCFAACDPLAQDCRPGSSCVAYANDKFLCLLDGSGDEGQTHDPCWFINACDPGNVCAPTTAASECDTSRIGCCQPYCDLTQSNTCPGEGQSCVPWQFNGETPPEHANLGYCSLPLP
jgi:hypothetical protein